MAQSQQHILMLTNIQNDFPGLARAGLPSGFPGFPGYQPDDKSDNHQYNDYAYPHTSLKYSAYHGATTQQEQHQDKG